MVAFSDISLQSSKAESAYRTGKLAGMMCSIRKKRLLEGLLDCVAQPLGPYHPLVCETIFISAGVF